MRLVFADTFYWIALADYTDDSHQQALVLTAELAAWKIVTTNEVLTEYLNFFSKSIQPSRRQVMQSVRGILRSPSIIVVPQSRRSLLSACDRYEARADKGYTINDCISMQTMDREGLKEVLTNDRHFEQEGFRALFHRVS